MDFGGFRLTIEIKEGKFKIHKGFNDKKPSMVLNLTSKNLNDLFERYMQICWQEKAQDWCTPGKTKIHLAFISIFCLLFNIPTFFEITW